MDRHELRDFLELKVNLYNRPEFIESDPIQLVHRFERKEDREILGLLVSTIAWGNRKAIIKSGEKLIKIMGESPHDFIMNYRESDFHFVHRTFNSSDLDFFFRALKRIYEKGGLEQAFSLNNAIEGTKGRIINFRNAMLQVEHENRVEKHLSNPLKNASCKRINMFLRWMVRKDKRGVDFGIWDSINSSELLLPLDVHTGNIARKLEILNRKQNDWKALDEIMEVLRSFDSNDPVKYDFALFGLGAFDDVIA